MSQRSNEAASVSFASHDAATSAIQQTDRGMFYAEFNTWKIQVFIPSLVELNLLKHLLSLIC